MTGSIKMYLALRMGAGWWVDTVAVNADGVRRMANGEWMGNSLHRNANGIVIPDTEMGKCVINIISRMVCLVFRVVARNRNVCDTLDDKLMLSTEANYPTLRFVVISTNSASSRICARQRFPENKHFALNFKCPPEFIISNIRLCRSAWSTG